MFETEEFNFGKPSHSSLGYKPPPSEAILPIQIARA